MCILTGVLLFVVSMVTISVTCGEDICLRCECLPTMGSPTQAICRDDNSPDKDFHPSTTTESLSLELIYVYGFKSVSFEANSIVTETPVTLLIQNCSHVNIADQAVALLRTLLVKQAYSVQVGILSKDHLWAVVLEDIDQLTVDSTSLSANYTVSIGHINALSLKLSGESISCNSNQDMAFTLFSSKVKTVPEGGLLLCGGNIVIKDNIFEMIAENGFQITTEGRINIEFNTFDSLSKQALNLSSPEIWITNNHFVSLPAGALREVSALQDTFFSNNTITDVDLGGVLLDMSWYIVIEHNTIDCDCTSKRTSILYPKEELLYLTNSSLEKLNFIFNNNFCNLNCTVSLKTFSYALTEGTVCVSNSTNLEQELLCETIVPEEDIILTSTENNNWSGVHSAASRSEFMVPLCMIVLTILITSSLCYGLREMNTFKFTFNPNTAKVSLPS